MIVTDILKKFFDKNEKTKVRRGYAAYYEKWYAQLMRYCSNLFKWNNLPCSDLTIESYLIWRGYCGITKNAKRGFIVVTGGLYGVTDYPLEFTSMTYATPLTSGVITIGENGTICNANRTRMPLTNLVDVYANTLAHIELSIQAASINQRQNMLAVADTQATADTINEWYKKMLYGDTMCVVDKNDVNAYLNEDGIKTLPTFTPTTNILTELYGIKQNTIRDFFTEIGFVSDKSKQERLVTAELSVNSFRVLFGISDMLKERRDFCARTKDVLGIDISVEFNEYILKEINNMIESEGNGE